MAKQAPRIGVVGIPGKWSTEVLADAVEQRSGFRLVIDMQQVHADLSKGSLIYQNQDLCQLDGLMVKKISAEYSPSTLDRLELLRLAESRGVRVFSPTNSMLRLVNRLSCTVTLRQHDIPMPPTIITEDSETALQAVQTFKEAVFKPLFSTKARGMTLLSSNQETQALHAAIQAYQRDNPVMYIQQKISLPGQDLGMMFLGGEYLGTYARVSGSATWNTTIHSGGRYAAFEAPQAYIDLARRAQAPFNMDFTTVDVAETEDGPIVFEVSAFGGFRGGQDGAGIDAATLYADYAFDHLGSP